MCKKATNWVDVALASPAPEDQRAIGPPKPEGIGKRMLKTGLARLVGDEVLFLVVGILIFQVDGRRRGLIPQSRHRDPRLESARAPQQVSGHRLSRTDGHFALPKEIPYRMR